MSRPIPVLLLLSTLLAVPALAQPVPALDHVIVVVMENKSYSQVANLPYTAAFRGQGATLANSYAVVRPSQPNYFALWAGNTYVTNNNCPAAGSPWGFANLGNACETAGKTWRAYSENLAVVGGTACSYDGNATSGLYTRKHAPWTYFTNLNHQNERPYTDLAVDIANNQLPNLAFVVPNNCHNSHNSTTPGCGIVEADQWLSQNVPAMLSAVGPNGVVVITYDEDDSNNEGNRILTAIVGSRVIPGVVSNQRVYHYTLLRTICDALGLPAVGAAFSEVPITGIWQEPVPVRGASWGRLKTLYR